MRFVIAFLFFLFLVFGPILFYTLDKKVSAKVKFILFLIPTLFMIFYALIASKIIFVGAMTLCMVNMSFILFLLPVNFYLLFELIYLWLKKKKGKDLKWIKMLGAILSISLFLVFIKGIIDRKDLEVRETVVNVENLPESFRNLKIVQISDVHLGNLDDKKEYLERIVEMSNQVNPDLVFLTGDIVNSIASEGDGLDGIFDNMKAKYGRFAVLGNHDYGKYYKWSCDADSIKNLDAVKKLCRDMGMELLLNENKVIVEGEDSLVIAGIENCGEEPFPCYADFDKTFMGTEGLPVLLLSHDPSSWRTKVLNYPNVLVTFSGHTHAAQMGLEIGDFKFSPAQFMYEDWDGLYEEEGQFLYISRGVGYVAIPFRLGMKPEISVIELERN